MFEIDDPRTGADLIGAFTRLQAETARYFAAMPPAAFFAPQGKAWAPSAHVRHLVVPVQLVRQGLRTPKPFLRLLFGRPRRPPRDFAAVRATYLGALSNGAQAPYTSSAKSPSADLVRGRTSILVRMDRAIAQLTDGISTWKEDELDQYRLPHPFIGRLTVREMLYFILYHNAHHVRRVAERASASTP